MLIRILADNPGQTFTRNIDNKFTSTIKDLLRNGRDPSVQQILRETLQALYFEKAYDTNLTNLFNMWGKESGSGAQRPPQNAVWMNSAQQQQQQQQQRHQEWWSHPGPATAGLPPTAELAARIEEAKTSAKLLQQFVQSTATSELQTNELVKEFAERCQSAQRSMQNYINCNNPVPDADTMQTLIEASEQLSLAASKHQRALLQARRATDAFRPTPSPRNELVNGSSISQSSIPTLSQPALPHRQNNGQDRPTTQTSATLVPVGPLRPPLQPMPTTTTYSPPPNPPSSMRESLERRTTAQSLTPQSPPQPQRHHSRERSHSSANSLYSDHNIASSPPSTAQHQSTTTDDYDSYRAEANAVDAPIPALPGRGAMAMPSSLQPTNGTENRQPSEFRPTIAGSAGDGTTTRPVELPVPGYGNPFSDENRRDSWEDEEDEEGQGQQEEDPTDTLYSPPGGGGTSMTSRVQAALSAAKAGRQRLTSTSPQQPGEAWSGQEGSHHYPGYGGMPSHTVRPDAAAEGPTMRAGRDDQETAAVNPHTHRMSEAEFSEVSDLGRGSLSDVSPVAERYPGRYRS